MSNLDDDDDFGSLPNLPSLPSSPIEDPDLQVPPFFMKFFKNPGHIPYSRIGYEDETSPIPESSDSSDSSDSL